MGIRSTAAHYCTAVVFLRLQRMPFSGCLYDLLLCLPKDRLALPFPLPFFLARSNYNAVLDETDLRETYFPGWQAAVSESRAQGVMCRYVPRLELRLLLNALPVFVCCHVYAGLLLFPRIIYAGVLLFPLREALFKSRVSYHPPSFSAATTQSTAFQRVPTATCCVAH